MQFWLTDDDIYMQAEQLPIQPSIQGVSGHPEVRAEAVAFRGLGISKAVSIFTQCSSNSRKTTMSSKLTATEAAMPAAVLGAVTANHHSYSFSSNCIVTSALQRQGKNNMLFSSWSSLALP